MKKIISFGISSVMLLTSVVGSAFAMELPSRPPHSGTPSAMKQEKMQERTDTRMDNLKNRANQEITRRIASLQKLLTRISEIKKITDSQKASFTSQVQTEINNLTTLQAKIQADTDTATLKTDVQSIVQSYRVYALFMPKIEILGAADRILTTSDQVTAEVTKLQTKIDEAKAKGKDVTTLQALLTDLQAKVTDAKLQAQNAITTVTPLTPDGYPGNKTSLESARTMIKTGHQDLLTAREDAKKIIKELLSFLKTLKPSGVPITPKPSTATTSATQ